MINMTEDSFFQNLNEHVDFGHAKRDNSFLRQVKMFVNGQGCSVSSSMADAMSSFRYAGNEKIKVADTRSIRMNSILSQCSDQEATLLINDVSLLNYYNHDSKADRRAIGDGKGKGYEYVCHLAVSLDDERPLGVIHDCLNTIDGPDDRDVVDYHSDKIFKEKLTKTEQKRIECNHKHQLVCHSRHIREQAPGKNFIMTADREFDDHFFFEECIPGKFDCVIRSNALRHVLVDADCDWVSEDAKTKKYPGLPKLDGFICADMRRLVKEVPTTYYKTISLDSKGRLTEPELEKSQAKLSVGVFKVVLYRDTKRSKVYFRPQKHVHLNVVVIREDNPPPDRDAILWVLFTTLPVNTRENILRICRIYELRWLIECFFKYLKSGYKVEFMRYDNAPKIAKILVVISIASAFLFSLKKDLRLPIKSLLDGDDYEKVKKATKNLNDSAIDIKLRLFAYIALQGGWLGRKRDPISPMTLMKGYKKLMIVINSVELLGENFLGELMNYIGQGREKNAYNR